MTDVSKTELLAKTDQGASDEPVDLLIRQVKNKMDLEGKDTTADAGCSFSELFQFTNGSEKCKIYFGWICAAVNGAMIPAFFFLIGDVFDSFIPDDPTMDPQEVADKASDKIRMLCLIMLIMAVVVTFAASLQNYLLMTAASSIGANLRTLYL